ncbi:hypothetical protein ACFUN8_18535 [Streptomyces sp. NPDC057307]|uniref:hypothetical protein n=1 Tax=Streptomyces sp. NPDC057307 TaxID=3346096 RepID=UPI00363292FE
MAWTTVSAIATLTGKDVSEFDLSCAQLIVELFSDVTEDEAEANSVSAKNMRYLSQAVMYQAIWLSENDDALTNHDIDTMTQDGLQFANNHANAGVLAPLAKRCIDRLKWNRNRNIVVRPASGILGDVVDDAGDWQAL